MILSYSYSEIKLSNIPLQIVFTCKIPKLQGVQIQKLVHFSSKSELYT